MADIVVDSTAAAAADVNGTAESDTPVDTKADTNVDSTGDAAAVDAGGDAKVEANGTTETQEVAEPVEVEEEGPKKRRSGRRKKTVEPAAAEAPPAKLKKKESTREKIPDISDMDFTCDKKSANGKDWNLKISSWNVNGLRAWIEKNGHSFLEHEKPDVLCLQETKCSEDKIPEECKIEGYEAFWSAAEQEGYSGTGMYCKEKPVKVTYGIGEEKHDKEGRTITAEFEKFYLVTAYVPNSGRGLPRLPYRTAEWDTDFRAYLKTLDETKPVILCGDLNVAHNDIDLANPKGNKKTAGFTPQEREEFTNLLAEGFVDSFRHLYPDLKDQYSYWTYMGNCRAKNVGWRLDYFVTSKRLVDDICDSVIRKDVMGSDHCPVTIMLAL